MNGNVITNKDGRLVSCVGAGATNAFRLKALLVALRLFAKTGLQVRRGFNVVTYAKRETGLKTRDTAKLIAAIETKLEAALDACTIVEANQND